MKMTAAIPVLTIFFLMLLIISNEEMLQSEAKICRAISKTLKGVCVSDKQCTDVCKTEGFTTGVCARTIFDGCECRKECSE